jgi:hypothetical protein
MDEYGEFPLTWAQEAWLAGPPRMDETDAWRHNVDVSVDVRGVIGSDHLRNTVRRLVQTYPTLRSRLRTGPVGSLVQVVDPPDSQSVAEAVARWGVREFRAEDPAGPKEQLRQHVTELAKDPYAPNLAVMLVPSPNARTRLLLAAAHAFVDAGGAHAIAADLKTALVTWERPEQTTIFRTLDFERSESGAETSDRAVRYLADAAETAQNKGFGESESQRRKEDINGCRISSRWMRQLLARTAPNSRLLRAAVMCSLGLVSYCAMRGREGACVATNVANRTTPEDADFVGLAFRTGWFTEELDPGMSFQSLIRRAASHLMSCSQHGRFDRTQAIETLARRGVHWRPSFYVNYFEAPGMGWGAGPWPTLESEWNRPEWEKKPAGPWAFEFNGYINGDSMSIIVKFDETEFSMGEANRFVSILRAVSLMVADNHAVRVGELLAAAVPVSDAP